MRNVAVHVSAVFLHVKINTRTSEAIEMLRVMIGTKYDSLQLRTTTSSLKCTHTYVVSLACGRIMN